jgi:hypothetical protein
MERRERRREGGRGGRRKEGRGRDTFQDVQRVCRGRGKVLGEEGEEEGGGRKEGGRRGGIPFKISKVSVEGEGEARCLIGWLLVAAFHLMRNSFRDSTWAPISFL